MPLYSYECKSCKNFFEESYRIAKRNIPTEKPCDKCDGEVVQVIMGMNIGDSVRLGITKPSSEFTEVLTKISDANPRSNLYQKLSQGHRKKGFD